MKNVKIRLINISKPKGGGGNSLHRLFSNFTATHLQQIGEIS